jgi:hypothetical protein
MTYEEYTSILGQNLSLHQLHYRKCIIDPDWILKIKSFKPVKILMITEPWCSDSLALLPIVRRISEINGQWNIKICRRDDNPELMDQFLTNGMRAIPVFLFMNEKFELLFRWGPRPDEAVRIYEKYRNQIKEGKIDKQEVMKKIRIFYAKDCGKTSLNELMKLTEQFLID